jgi:hypothetical protein
MPPRPAPLTLGNFGHRTHGIAKQRTVIVADRCVGIGTRMFGRIGTVGHAGNSLKQKSVDLSYASEPAARLHVPIFLLSIESLHAITAE